MNFEQRQENVQSIIRFIVASDKWNLFKELMQKHVITPKTINKYTYSKK